MRMHACMLLAGGGGGGGTRRGSPAGAAAEGGAAGTAAVPAGGPRARGAPGSSPGEHRRTCALLHNPLLHDPWHNHSQVLQARSHISSHKEGLAASLLRGLLLVCGQSSAAKQLASTPMSAHAPVPGKTLRLHHAMPCCPWWVTLSDGLQAREACMLAWLSQVWAAALAVRGWTARSALAWRLDAQSGVFSGRPPIGVVGLSRSMVFHDLPCFLTSCSLVHSSVLCLHSMAISHAGAAWTREYSHTTAAQVERPACLCGCAWLCRWKSCSASCARRRMRPLELKWWAAALSRPFWLRRTGESTDSASMLWHLTRTHTHAPQGSPGVLQRRARARKAHSTR